MKTDKLLNYLFYFSVLVFFIGFNFSDNPQGGWQLQTMPDLNGRSISDITFVDSLIGYAVTSYIANDTAYILKTTNSGDNWLKVFVRPTNEVGGFNRVQFLNQNTGFACRNFLWKTINGGLNWFNVNTSGIFPMNMWVHNEDTIWLIDDESMVGGVFRTTNGGQSWTQQLAAGIQNPDKIYMYNARIGFIVKNASGAINLRKTTNSGDNWFTVVTGEGFYDMRFIDSLTGWRAKDYIKKTTDGGLTWFQQTLPTGIPGHQIVWGMRNFSIINKDSLWGGYSSVIFPNLQYRGILYRTTNGGNNWYYQIPDTSLNVPLYNYISFINKNIGWGYTLSSTVNKGIHTLTGGDTTFYTAITQTGTEVPKEYLLYQNYPNPFNSITNVKFQMLSAGQVTINVYDLSGKEIRILVNEYKQAGTYSVSFNAEGLSSGVYFYRMKANNFTQIKKMILIK